MLNAILSKFIIFYFVLFLSHLSGIKSVDVANSPLSFATNDCFLTEPVYGHIFNFTSLHSDLAHVTISDKSDIFEYNICGNLTRKCADGNAAACFKRGKKEISLGTQHQLNYNNGRMFFSYTNGSACPSGGQYELYVYIGCDYTLDKKQSQITGYADNSCSFYITLETPLACLPEPDAVKSNTCSVRDPKTGFMYNLLPLSDVNYRVSNYNGAAFIINVCKPVLYGSNAMCPAGSSVCYESLKATDYKMKFFNYGTVQSDPIIENDQLLMRLPSTVACNATQNYTSTIYFTCDPDAKNPRPKYLGQHGCNLSFSFITPLACSRLPPCSVIMHGNEIIDMSSLQNKPFTLQQQGKSYTFAVCGNAGAPCLENHGSCFTESNGQSTSLGLSNSQLRSNQTGSPYLLYESGAACQKSDATKQTGSQTFWSTKIEFVCANNATKDNGNSGNAPASAATAMGPKIIENSNCQLLIHYQTDLACHEQIACKAKWYSDEPNGDADGVLDLTPLISATENYVATVDASITEKEVGHLTKFYLNVCRPLVPKYGLGCPGGSAACMAKVGTSTPEDEQSLGYPAASLVAINRTTATLRYLQGGVCPTDKVEQLSSGIEFYCDMRAGRGTPILKSISDCHYQFDWPTNVLCPPHTCSFDENTCEIVNDELNVRYGLRAAPYTDGGKLRIGASGSSQFSIDICGKNRTVVTDYVQGIVDINFSENGPCIEDGKVDVHLRLICSHLTERVSSFSDGTQCNLIYTQRTPDVCKFLGLAVPTASTTAKPNDDHEQASSTTTAAPVDDGGKAHPAEKTGSIGAILAAILSVTFFVACLGAFAFSPARRNSVRRCFRRSTSAVRYSRVQSNEEANLLLDPNGHFTDSDDDMLL